MNKKSKEPFLVGRTLNMVLGFVILLLILLVIYKNSETRILEIIIFTLAAIANYIAATINFSEKKKVRGNFYAFSCTVFFIAAIVMIVSFFGMI